MSQSGSPRLRKIISRGFTPRAINRFRDELNERAQDIVKTAAAEQVACELPMQATAELLGVPFEDRRKLSTWSNEMTGHADPEFAHIGGATAAVELIGYAMQLANIKAADPGEDIVTTLINADIEGEKLSDDKVRFLPCAFGCGRQRHHT